MDKEEALPGNSSPNTTAPSTAVTPKFAAVFMTLTLTALSPIASALVNNPHMTALKARFSPKKHWRPLAVSQAGGCRRRTYGSDTVVNYSIPRFEANGGGQRARERRGDELGEDAVQGGAAARGEGVGEP